MRREISAMRRFQGRACAPGVARGGVLVYEQEIPTPTPRQHPPGETEAELARLEAAIKVTEGEILQARERVSEELGEDHARIFDAHRFILLDEIILGQARQSIRAGWCAETAYAEACQNIVRSFQSMGGDLPDRSLDLRDVEKRVLGQLQGRQVSGFKGLAQPVIVVARDIRPSDTATMDRRMVLGFVTEAGGAASHSVILGRSLGIPVIVGVEGLLEAVQTGDDIILDGNSGLVVLHPDAQAEEQFVQLQAAYEALEQESLRYKDYPAETRDGRQIALRANIELPEEVTGALSHGAAGVGLYRTEYLFLTQPNFPDEESQHQAYVQVLTAMAPDPVTLRCMDLGGEKVAAYMNFPREDNPSLGWRGIRYALSHPEIFRTQLRAIYRASVHGNLRVMIPMISQVDEIRQTRALIAQVQAELLAEGVPLRPDVPLGIMIETPSAVAIAHLMAKEVDFFSIGTNDLIQYSLAIDRDNRYVHALYDPFHPAILRQIRRTVQAAKDQKIGVGLCGELPEDPLFTILLIGLGLEEISVNPYRIPEIKRVIRSITYDQARILVRRAWSCATADEIRGSVGRLAQRKFPELAEAAGGNWDSA